MNQQGPPGSANAAFLPPPRQEMEYLCAGEKHVGTGLITVFFNVSKIAVPKMKSNLESPSGVGNADTVSCTRKEQNEVSSNVPLCCYRLDPQWFVTVVQFEAR